MKKRNLGIDVLKLLACLGVVFLHVAGNAFDVGSPLTITAYIYYLGTLSIPLFFLINGYFLLNKSNLTIAYLSKKIQAIVIAVVIWSSLYWLASQNFQDNLIRKILGAFLQRGYFFQFWFLGSLIVIYLTLPVLKRLIYSYRVHLYLTMSLLILGVLLQLANFFTDLAPLQSHVIQTFRLWTWYGYYLLGGLLGRSESQVFFAKRNQQVIKWLTVVGILVMPIILYYVATQIFANKYAEYFYDSILVKVLVVGLFISLQNQDFSKYQKMIIKLSPLIMGVFVVHYYIMLAVGRLLDLTSNLSNIVALVIVLVASFVVSDVISRIPYLRETIKL